MVKPAKYEGPSKEVLEAAAIIAPIVRSIPEKARQRRVHVYKPESGETVGVRTYGEIVNGLVAAYGLAIKVNDGVRPSSVQCAYCRKPLAVNKGASKVVSVCRDGCACSCGAVITANGVRRALRNGKTPKCRACFMAGFVADGSQRAEEMATIRSRGSLRPLADGFEARIRIDATTRKGFELIACGKDEAAARARCEAMASMAARLRKAGHSADAVRLMEMAARANAKTLSAIREAVHLIVCGMTERVRA